MKLWCVLANVVAGIALASPAGAQEQAEVPLALSVKDDGARILGSGDIRFGEHDLRVLLVGTADRLWLRIVDAESSYNMPMTVPLAVAMLSDRRLSFLWAGLTEWGGGDLVRLRNAHIAWTAREMMDLSSRGFPLTSGQSLSSPGIATLMQHADALMLGGRSQDAIALLRAALPVRVTSNREKVDLSILAVALARHQRTAGDKAGAELVLNEAARLLRRSTFGLNLKVNRASFLAFDGRYAEALTEIDSALATFSRESSEHRVPGSFRQFSWVRACALAGLGRTAEARALVYSIEAVEEPTDPAIVLESNNSIRTRMRMCMRDGPAITAALVENGEEDWVTNLIYYVQPGFEPPLIPPELLAAIRADPEVRRIAAERLRVLPPELLPAMRAWREPARN